MKLFSIFLGLFMIAFSVFLQGCDVETQSIVNPSEKSFTYGFEKDEQGWAGAFADYPVGEDAFYEVSFEHDTLPENLPQRGALRMSGNNHSDDLLMFLKKQVSGLKPFTAYNIVFNVAFASQYPENSVGVGGSPGASVVILVGAMQNEPTVIKVDQEGGEKFNTPNFDHRIPFERGQKTEDVLNIGNIGIPGEVFDYTLITRSNEDIPFEATSDKDGRLWVIVGTDSGFEATTTLFYDEIGITFQEK